MVTCLKSTLIKGYEHVGLQQEGIMPLRRLGICSVEPPYYSSIDVNMMTSAHMLAFLPNQSFVGAIDITTIEKDIMLMNLKNHSETEDILSDPIIMDALRCADRQYHEGKAIPLEDLMRELGFGEDEL